MWRVLFEEYGIQHVEEALLLGLISIVPLVILTTFGPALTSAISSVAARIPSP